MIVTNTLAYFVEPLLKEKKVFFVSCSVDTLQKSNILDSLGLILLKFFFFVTENNRERLSLCKPLNPSLMFVGKARSLPKTVVTERRLENTRSSLFGLLVSDEEKSFITLTTGLYFIELFSLLLTI
jgi:hypothetical protein